MKTPWFVGIVAAMLFSGAAQATDGVIPTPNRYFKGPVCRDVGDAIKRGAGQNKKVWIIAWDADYYKTPEHRKTNVADYNLSWFYSIPQTKDLLSKNFVQVFTTMNNPAIQQWIDPKDETHIPYLIILDSDGTAVVHKRHDTHAEEALKLVESLIDGQK